ncbi:hypothetical protein HII36_05555 [Nonomuraea sp. NN258]|uniref:hypothetical protein n=1 Tax=Nonomuraea antri TaxID=2730852 RepID=UPI00156A29CD|nr:hypothetical protein [Nonomuraea antri]NRQ31304.1 hypothetical protein [Nonomuraea antri]
MSNPSSDRLHPAAARSEYAVIYTDEYDNVQFRWHALDREDRELAARKAHSVRAWQSKQRIAPNAMLIVRDWPEGDWSVEPHWGLEMAGHNKLVREMRRALNGTGVTVNDWAELTCRCGNTPERDGFQPCTETGEPCEPTTGWAGHYSCGGCGIIIATSGGGGR